MHRQTAVSGLAQNICVSTRVNAGIPGQEGKQHLVGGTVGMDVACTMGCFLSAQLCEQGPSLHRYSIISPRLT